MDLVGAHDIFLLDNGGNIAGQSLTGIVGGMDNHLRDARMARHSLHTAPQGCYRSVAVDGPEQPQFVGGPPQHRLEGPSATAVRQGRIRRSAARVSTIGVRSASRISGWRCSSILASVAVVHSR